MTDQPVSTGDPRPETDCLGVTWSDVKRLLADADAESPIAGLRAIASKLEVERVARALCADHQPDPIEAGFAYDEFHVDDACRSRARRLFTAEVELQHARSKIEELENEIRSGRPFNVAALNAWDKWMRRANGMCSACNGRADDPEGWADHNRSCPITAFVRSYQYEVVS